MRSSIFILVPCLLLAGCTLLPDIAHQPQFHNPFPQLQRVAVLPFYNQSEDPHVDGEQVALAYFNELQLIPGFEVMPVGVVKRYLEATKTEPHSAEDFQRLARAMGVDAVVVGSVTDFSPYYPPRIGLAVNWYAANPCFHPIPPGYGLPWGTADEEYIPDALVRETEFALAREQLKTQTPAPPAALFAAPLPLPVRPKSGPAESSERAKPEKLPPPKTPLDDKRGVPGNVPPLPVEPGVEARRSAGTNPAGQLASLNTTQREPLPLDAGSAAPSAPLISDAASPLLQQGFAGGTVPPEWPDPRGLVPSPPRPHRPACVPQHAPVIVHTRIYNGHDERVTEALANYFYFRDDARFGGWQAYLQRSEDFIRFACYLHVTETLAARGGADQTRVVWRWPIGRYER